MQLTARQRLTWLAHVWKATAYRYHGEVREALERHIAPGSVVIDVGAHAGHFTKLFARAAPDVTVLAVEPGSYARSVLSVAVRLNRLSNVEICPVALSAAAGTLQLNVPVKPSGSLGFGLGFVGDAGAAGRPVVSESVEALTLDDLLRRRFGRISDVSLIKADIEGHEHALFEGALATLEEARPALFVEVVRQFLERAGSSAGALFELLRRAGYEPAEVASGERRTWAAFEAGFADADCLFLPAARAGAGNAGAPVVTA